MYLYITIPIILHFLTCSNMGKVKNFGGMKRGSIEMIRYIMVKLQAGFSLSKGVREGHFVVVATEGWEPKRFVAELGCLHNPEFLKLLKQAEDEFGFYHEGALAIPCHPEELQHVLNKGRL